MSTKPKLSASEQDFLREQNIELVAVYDASHAPKKVWQPIVKEMPDVVIVANTSPCRKAKHRLKTRSGHCAQCNTSRIAYVRNYKKSGVLYIAVSDTEGIVKIGISSNVSARNSTLNSTKYAGCSDWKIVKVFDVEGNAGQYENALKSELQPFAIKDRFYEKSGHSQLATEIFSVSPAEAIRAFESLGIPKDTSLKSQSTLAKNRDKKGPRNTFTGASHRCENLKVVGGYYYDVKRLYINGALKKGAPVYLKANPLNKHDENAIEVYLQESNAMLGHLPARTNRTWGMRLKSNQIVSAHVLSYDEADHSSIIIRVDFSDSISKSKSQGLLKTGSVLKPSEAGIYQIESLKTKRLYIGSSLKLKKRFQEHRHLLMSHLHHNVALQKDFSSVDSGDFIFTPIWSVKVPQNISKSRRDKIKQELNEREERVLRELKVDGRKLFNRTLDGQGYITAASTSARSSRLVSTVNNDDRKLDDLVRTSSQDKLALPKKNVPTNVLPKSIDAKVKQDIEEETSKTSSRYWKIVLYLAMLLIFQAIRNFDADKF
ncbi:MAG: GIY-YIG nuclease family protein [Pseudomonadales bacterium]